RRYRHGRRRRGKQDVPRGDVRGRRGALPRRARDPSLPERPGRRHQPTDLGSAGDVAMAPADLAGDVGRNGAAEAVVDHGDGRLDDDAVGLSAGADPAATGRSAVKPAVDGRSRPSDPGGDDPHAPGRRPECSRGPRLGHRRSVQRRHLLQPGQRGLRDLHQQMGAEAGRVRRQPGVRRHARLLTPPGTQLARFRHDRPYHARVGATTAAHRRAGAERMLDRSSASIVAIAAMCGMLAALAWQQGGYFGPSYLHAGAVGFALLAGLLLIARPNFRLSREALVALGALLAFAVWTWIASSWSATPTVGVENAQRDLVYLSMFGVAVTAAGSGRSATVA